MKRSLTFGAASSPSSSVVVGLTTLRFDETLRSALIEIAPVHAWLVELLG